MGLLIHVTGRRCWPNSIKTGICSRMLLKLAVSHFTRTREAVLDFVEADRGQTNEETNFGNFSFADATRTTNPM